MAEREAAAARQSGSGSPSLGRGRHRGGSDRAPAAHASARVSTESAHRSASCGSQCGTAHRGCARSEPSHASGERDTRRSANRAERLRSSQAGDRELARGRDRGARSGAFGAAGGRYGRCARGARSLRSRLPVRFAGTGSPGTPGALEQKRRSGKKVVIKFNRESHPSSC